MNSAPLSGPRALVTGGSRGIGAAIVRSLAQGGARVAAMGRDADALAGVVDEVNARVSDGSRAHGVVGELSDPTEVGRIYDDVLGVLGGDPQVVVINHAARGPAGSLHRAQMTDVVHRYQADVFATIALLQRPLMAMSRAKYGRVVLIGSMASEIPPRGVSIYASIKGALRSLAFAIASDYGPMGITCNIVAPGLVHTRRLEETLPSDVSHFTDRSAAGRLGRPEEIAAVVAFLCSKNASYVNGVTVPVHGGLSG